MLLARFWPHDLARWTCISRLLRPFRIKAEPKLAKEEDKKHGEGCFRWADGRQYSGQWKDGKQHGMGKLLDLNGKVWRLRGSLNLSRCERVTGKTANA